MKNLKWEPYCHLRVCFQTSLKFVICQSNLKYCIRSVKTGFVLNSFLLRINIPLKKILLEHTLCIEERLYQIQFMSKEERYKELVEEAPEILQRVSLTDIASLLGMNRETLSRLRAKK